MTSRVSSYSSTIFNRSGLKSLREFATACGLALALALPSAEALAQAAQPVELSGEVQVERVVKEANGERRVLEKPDTVVPGDKLVFTTNYRNAGPDIVKEFVVTNPLPEAIRLSAEDAAVLELSVDGGTSWGKLAALTVNDGKGGKRPAGVDDITHIRWSFPEIAPGAKGAVTYHGTVR